MFWESTNGVCLYVCLYVCSSYENFRNHGVEWGGGWCGWVEGSEGVEKGEDPTGRAEWLVTPNGPKTDPYIKPIFIF